MALFSAPEDGSVHTSLQFGGLFADLDGTVQCAWTCVSHVSVHGPVSLVRPQLLGVPLYMLHISLSTVPALHKHFVCDLSLPQIPMLDTHSLKHVAGVPH